MDHTIVFFDIPAGDVEKIKKFYSELFGWKIDRLPGPLEYYSVMTVPADEKRIPIRAGVNGGLYAKKDAQDPQMAKQQINYVWVESIDEYSKKIEKLGGKIKIPKTEVPGRLRWALAVDPDGTYFGLVEYIQK